MSDASRWAQVPTTTYRPFPLAATLPVSPAPVIGTSARPATAVAVADGADT